MRYLELSAHMTLTPPALPPDDDLMAWISELRARLDRGELAALDSIDVGYGARILRAEHTIQIMLMDLDSFDEMEPADAADPVNVARYLGLLADFRVLRLLLR